MDNSITKEDIVLSQIVADGFYQYHQAFRQYTYASKSRFENRQWKEQRQALQERTDQLERVVEQTASQLQTHFNGVSDAEKAGMLQKEFISGVGQANTPIAHCFFDALLPQLLPASWYNYFALPNTSVPLVGEDLKMIDRNTPLQTKVQQLLLEIGFEASFADIEADVHWISRQLIDYGSPEEGVSLSVLPSLFYRNQHAYLLGYLHRGQESSPLAIAFVHPGGGIRADAVLLSESDIKNLFALSRSYFLVETADPIGLVVYIPFFHPSL
jgi:isocitrate dehydrogenase kinase/phosphatase